MVRMPKSRLLLHWKELLELRLIHYQISMYFFRLMGMATLWWSWSQYTLSEASEDIGEVIQAIAQELPSLRYTSVQLAEDLHGFKGDFLLAVVYLYIGGRNFWQVAACRVNGTVAEAQAK